MSRDLHNRPLLMISATCSIPSTRTNVGSTTNIVLEMIEKATVDSVADVFVSARIHSVSVPTLRLPTHGFTYPFAPSHGRPRSAPSVIKSRALKSQYPRKERHVHLQHQEQHLPLAASRPDHQHILTVPAQLHTPLHCLLVCNRRPT